VLEPVFEARQTPPVLASFKADANPILRFFGFGIGTTFTTGDAAEAMSSLFTRSDEALAKEIDKVPCPSNGQLKPCDIFSMEKDFLETRFGSHIVLTKHPEKSSFFGSWGDSKSGYLKPGETIFGVIARSRHTCDARTFNEGRTRWHQERSLEMDLSQWQHMERLA